MIQRIQSLYLFIVFAINSLLIITNPVYAEFQNKDGISPSTVLMQYTFQFNTQLNNSMPVPAYKLINILLLGLIGLGSITTIFLFKNRKFQLKLSTWVMILNVLLITALMTDYFLIKKEFASSLASTTLGFQVIWPFVMLIMNILAFRGIKADEKLLKSMDRIR